MSVAQHRLALPAGYELGRYRFQEILGSGGFGITYLAEDKTLGRRVAIKELLPNDIATRVDGTTVVAKTQSEEQSLSWARERFIGEGRALAACDHPNVVNVYEMVEANGTAYMVTKYEEGSSLEQWLRELERPPNESELRSVLLPLLSGLETVHKAGFLHRDIKPENIYITKNGRPVLLDFGSARQAISNRSIALTSIVTSGYAPFEQYHEDGNQGAWSDIYALAAVMYRAITGKKPPEATRRLQNDPIEKLTARYAGQYDAEFLRAIDRGLSVNEFKRPQSVADWRKMFGSDDRLPVDTDLTRVMPRVKREPALDKLLTSPRLLDVGVPVAVVLVLGLAWIITRWGSHSSSSASNRKSGDEERPSQSSSASPSQSAPPVLPSSSPGNESSTAAVTPAPSAQPGSSPAAPAGLQLDPRLIGTWESARNGRGQRTRWEQSQDGHYTFTGAVTDAGVISAADGQMKEFSNGAAQPVDVTYQFRGETLITNTPAGTLEWRRVSSSASTSKRQPARPNQPSRPDIGRDLLHRVLRKHFP